MNYSHCIYTKEINAYIHSIQCSLEKFHVSGSMVLIFSLEWGNPEKWARCSSLASVEKLQFIHVQNYKTPSSISFKVLIISSTLKDTNSSCSLRSLRIMHSCCWNAADRSLSRWSSPYKSWIFLSFSSCKHGWAYQGWANEKKEDLGSIRNVGRIQ